MLLRAAWIYSLAVLSLMLTLALLLGRLELGASRETAVTLAERVLHLQDDLETERLNVQAAERRALIAEDTLARASTQQVEAVAAASGSRLKLAEELTEALRQRDAAKAEAARLANELENTQVLLRVAEKSAAIARVAAEETARVKAQAAAAATVNARSPVTATAAKQGLAPAPAAMVEAPKPAIKPIVADTPVAKAISPDTAVPPSRAAPVKTAGSSASIETSSIAPPAVVKAPVVAAEKAKPKPAKSELRREAKRALVRVRRPNAQASKAPATEYGITPF